MAIAALIVGIFGLCCFGITGPVAVFLGITSRNKIRDSGGVTKGEGLSLAATICGVIGTIELVVAIALVVLILLQNR